MVVREEVTTVALRVVPVSVPAGAVPEMFPVTLPVRVPVRLPVAEVKKRLVVEAVVAKKLVEVELVVVDVRPVNDWRVVEPVWSVFEKVERAPVAVRNVPTENAPVVVELVVVDVRPVNDWKVDDPVTKRFERVVWPDVTPRVPGKV